MMATLLAVPLAVRQLVALELLEAGQRAHDRAVAVDTDERYGGAVDLLSQQAHVYRTLARLLTEADSIRGRSDGQ